MTPTSLTIEESAPGRIRLRSRPDVYSLSDLNLLAGKSDRTDVQRFLSQAIHDGLIRVRPCPGAPARVLIIRNATDSVPTRQA